MGLGLSRALFAGMDRTVCEIRSDGRGWKVRLWIGYFLFFFLVGNNGVVTARLDW